MSYQPYKFWSKSDLAAHLKALANVFELGHPIKNLIEEGVLSMEWDPLLDYDGCTIVQDITHPCLSCFIHDYLWRTGQGGRESDQLFYFLMRAEGTSIARTRRRWFAVRVIWLAYYKWKHFARRNVNPYSKGFLRVIDYMNQNKKDD